MAFNDDEVIRGALKYRYFLSHFCKVEKDIMFWISKVLNSVRQRIDCLRAKTGTGVVRGCEFRDRSFGRIVSRFYVCVCYPDLWPFNT